MKTIDERIEEHEKLIKKLHDGKEELERMLNRMTDKISFHLVAIENLKNKKDAIERNK